MKCWGLAADEATGFGPMRVANGPHLTWGSSLSGKRPG
jgi:hypothetical protein